ITRTVPITDDIITTYIYDEENRLIGTRDALYDGSLSATLHVTGTAYNDLEKAQFTTNSLGKVTSYLYDSAGNLIQTTYPGDADTAVAVTRTVYDNSNRPLYTQARAVPDSVSGDTTV